MAHHAQTSHRGRQFDPHPVPAHARASAHIGRWFAERGTQQFTPNTNGREIAEELARNLRPSARAALLNMEPIT